MQCDQVLASERNGIHASGRERTTIDETHSESSSLVFIGADDMTSAEAAQPMVRGLAETTGEQVGTQKFEFASERENDGWFVTPSSMFLL